MKLCFYLLLFMVTFNLYSCQRGFIRNYDHNYCQTPLGDAGSCVSLKFCPEVLTLFEKLQQNSAKQYSMQLQRICGNRITPDQYPVVCCTNVVKDVPIIPITTTTTTTTTEKPTTTSTEKTFNRTIESQYATCLTKDLKTGNCKPLQSCTILYDQLKNDPSNEQVKENLRSAHTLCGNTNTDVCCPPVETAAARDFNIPIHVLPSEDEGCGSVNISQPKIVGGDDSQLGAWPWMALIGYDPYSVRPFKCGGTLVSARHVITAAHCIRQDLSFVRLGEYDLSIESETHHLDINVIKHANHPQYGKDRRSDLAILLLEKNVQFSDLISPICMPNSIRLRSKSYEDSMPFVAGWGHTMQGGNTSPVLKQAQLPVLNNDVCRRIYTTLLPSLTASEYDEAIICAGYTIGGTDTCQGDSGGPLMIPELYKGVTRYYLIGVVSYGYGCGKHPGIYISTQHWMDWIVDQIATM